MSAQDISTAIQGHVYVIENVNNPLLRIQSMIELQKLRSRISNDKRLNSGPLMHEINKSYAKLNGTVLLEYEEEETQAYDPASSICGAVSLGILGVSVIGTFVYGLISLVF